MAKDKAVEATTEAPEAEGSETKVGPMHEAFAAFITENKGIEISPEQVFAVTSTRVAFRKSEGYLVGVKQAKEEARLAALAAKEEAAKAREAERAEAKAAKEAAKAEKAEAAAAAKAEREAKAAAKAAEKEAAAAAKAAKGDSAAALAAAEKEQGTTAKKTGKAASKTKAPF